MSFWDTPTKDIPRHAVMGRRRFTTKRPRAAATSLTLPGDQLLCVKRGHETGLFNQHTQHVFVERNRDVQRSIVRKSKQFLDCKWDPILWRSQIHTMPLRSVLSNQPLEFGYLDFCAALNQQVARWVFTELSPALADGAAIAVTLSRNYRASKYMQWWSKAVAKRGSQAQAEFLRVEQQINDAACAGNVSDRFNYLDDSQQEWVDSYGLSGRGVSKWNQLLSPEYHDASVKVISAFTVLLANFDYDLETCIEYARNPKVSTYMTTFVLRDLRRRDEPRISNSLLRAIGENVSPAMRPIINTRSG